MNDKMIELLIKVITLFVLLLGVWNKDKIEDRVHHHFHRAEVTHEIRG